MVADEDDDGAFGKAESIERVEQASNLCVEKTDRRVVGANRFALALLIDGPVRRVREERRRWRAGERLAPERRGRNAIQRIEIEVLAAAR